VKTVKKKILILALIFAMLALPISGVFAKNEKFIHVSGTIFLTYDGQIENIQKGKSDTWVLTGTDWSGPWIGGIEGTGVYNCRWALHKFDPATFESNIVPQEIWILSDPTIDSTPYEGDLIIGGSPGGWRIIGGTEDLANVHGQGTKLDINPFTIGYEGWIHFDP
jgi:hypothetical protein